VQMSSGIAEAGMHAAGSDKPVPLPVQALDHATGYLMAAAAVRGLTRRQTGGGSQYRLSLARTARLLADYPAASGQSPLAPETMADVHPHLEMTVWGPARRLRRPLSVGVAAMAWDRPASPLRSVQPAWS